MTLRISISDTVTEKHDSQCCVVPVERARGSSAGRHFGSGAGAVTKWCSPRRSGSARR